MQFCDCDLGGRTQAFWQRKQSEQHSAKLAKLFDAAGVPDRYRTFTVDSFQKLAKGDPAKVSAIAAAKALIVQGYIDVEGKRKTGAMFMGPYGTGKTGAATPILRYWLDQGKSGLWIEFYDFCDRVQAGYAKGDSEAVMDAAKQADWVLLDDVGDLQRDDKATGFAETTDRQKLLYQLVNYRHNHGLPLLLTTNLEPAQFAVQFGARTSERLLESCHVVYVGGRNLRGDK